MFPRNGYSKDGQSKDQNRFKKRGKKLNNYQKQKPKHKRSFLKLYEENLDYTPEEGLEIDISNFSDYEE